VPPLIHSDRSSAGAATITVRTAATGSSCAYSTNVVTSTVVTVAATVAATRRVRAAARESTSLIRHRPHPWPSVPGPPAARPGGSTPGPPGPAAPDHGWRPARSPAGRGPPLAAAP